MTRTMQNLRQQEYLLRQTVALLDRKKIDVVYIPSETPLGTTDGTIWVTWPERVR